MRQSMESPVTRYEDDILSLNINKTKELIINFKKWGGVHTLVSIDADEV